MVFTTETRRRGTTNQEPMNPGKNQRVLQHKKFQSSELQQSSFRQSPSLEFCFSPGFMASLVQLCKGLRALRTLRKCSIYYPRPPSQQVSQIVWQRVHWSLWRISISVPPHTGQAGRDSCDFAFAVSDRQIGTVFDSCIIFLHACFHADVGAKGCQTTSPACKPSC